MKTLKLPGLEDTYTFLQNDTTLAVSGKAADAKATGDALAAVQAQVEGVQAGQYPDMGAGQLLSTTGTVNPTPYTYRENASGSDRVTISQITGGTVAWNQLVDTATTSVTVASGHKYVALVGGTWSVGASDGTALTVTGGTDMVFDLTQMFGSAVADYIYGLETATAGAGVALFRTMFPESYYPYNAGELVSVQTSGRKTVGYNLFDKEAATRDKFYWGNGQENYYPSLGHSDFIRVTPGVSYYTNVTPITNVYKCIFFDSDKRYVSRTSTAPFTAPAGAVYMAINFRLEEIDSLVVNISDPARNGQYEPYSAQTYPLDSTMTLRGIPVLSGGVPAYDGDKYAPDGTVTRRYGIVDLGTLTWTSGTASGGVYRMQTQGLNGLFKPPATNTTAPAFLCTKYVTSTPNATYSGTTGITGSKEGNVLYVYDPNYSAQDSGDAFKTAMSGVYLVYELATPTIEIAAPYQEIQIAGSTEEFLHPATDTRAAAVPVGSVSLYQTNMRAGLEKVLGTLNGADPAHAESIAPVQGSTASTNIAEGELLMHDGKLYAATQAIVAGAEIGATNTIETTLAAQLAALEARIAALEN